jgi:glutamyl endopeptidase
MATELEFLTSPAVEAEAELAEGESQRHEGSPGPEDVEPSASANVLVVSGKSDIPHVESVIPPFDERVRVTDTEHFPWRMVCALRMTGPSGTGGIGTGWFIGPRTVITAGHCVFSQTFFGGWARSVEVIPGLNRRSDRSLVEPFGRTRTSRLSVLRRWADSDDREPDYDIGCIHLQEPLGEKTGWFGFGALTPTELRGFQVNIAGYPGNPGDGNEQWFATNRVLHVSERRAFYDVDTTAGQSGGPVWIHEKEGSLPLAVAVHAYGVGGTPSSLGILANSAPRIVPELFDLFQRWLALDGAPATRAA